VDHSGDVTERRGGLHQLVNRLARRHIDRSACAIPNGDPTELCRRRRSSRITPGTLRCAAAIWRLDAR
jgi:hypothetical protein